MYVLECRNGWYRDTFTVCTFFHFIYKQQLLCSICKRLAHRPVVCGLQFVILDESFKYIVPVVQSSVENHTMLSAIWSEYSKFSVHDLKPYNSSNIMACFHSNFLKRSRCSGCQPFILMRSENTRWWISDRSQKQLYALRGIKPHNITGAIITNFLNSSAIQCPSFPLPWY